jgi:diguanylate cyclase (GGDEF)-like protein/PAS domain S-box-containing protein
VVFRELVQDEAAGRLDEGVLVSDHQGRIVAASPGFTRITGYAEDEVRGRTPAVLKSGVHTPAFYRNFWRQLNASRFWRGELWNRRKNGEIYPQWTSIHGLVDETGALLNHVAVFADISKAKKVEEQLHHLANHDALTGLPNQQLLNERLNLALERARNAGRKLAVALIDLDHFKMINETLGHVSGDRFLYQVATRLVQAAQRDDLIARWGGDEFVVVMEAVAGPREAVERLHRFVDALDAPVRLTGREIMPAASIGVSLFPDDGSDASGLIQAADTAMYRAKDSGRNRVEFYTSQMTEAAQRRFALAVELRQALRNDEFVLHYQPQVNAADGRLIGFEALVRWQHPDKGLVPPGQFIALAEELGLIADIGVWVLRQACAQLRAWREACSFDYQIAVNVAPGQLEPGFVDVLHSALEDYGVPPQLIEVEITESALQPTSEIVALLAEIRQLGVKLAIDDFGTGYSSLAHLKHFPVDRFKIDKSFVDGVPQQKHDVAIARTVIALGKSLDINVLAEGVETAEQIAFLRAEGVDAIQGYAFGRPMPPADVAALVARERSSAPGA